MKHSFVRMGRRKCFVKRKGRNTIAEGCALYVVKTARPADMGVVCQIKHQPNVTANKP